MYKKLALSGLVILAFVAYSFVGRHNDHSVQAPATLSTGGTSPGSGSTNSNSGSGSSGTTQASYKDGTYTGSVADAFYGNVQVQVTISGGKITDVNFLQYPNDRTTSQQINSQAMPYLKQEAIQAQSANVNGVTGATDTSQAFIQSLTKALSQA